MEGHLPLIIDKFVLVLQILTFYRKGMGEFCLAALKFNGAAVQGIAADIFYQG
jgi:hypothetical protein